MSNPIEFRRALSNSYPSGTGSYNYDGSFEVVVQNLAFEKQVSIWAQVGGTWKEIPAGFSAPLPGNREMWKAPATDSEDQFVAKYTVNGTTYWDNNHWLNYKFPKAFDEFSALLGSNYPVALGSGNLDATKLSVQVAVQNLAYAKVVGVVFTTDNWATAQSATGNYSWTMASGLEVWTITVPLTSAPQVKFAIFYRVLGAEFWDNNFGRNYTVAPGAPAFAQARPAQPGLRSPRPNRAAAERDSQEPSPSRVPTADRPASPARRIGAQLDLRQ